MTDIMGNLLHIKVHAANIHDTVAGSAIVKATLVKYPAIKGICGDAGYRGTFVLETKQLGLSADISERINPGWGILPKRWRVERTFGWANASRRLSKDYEISAVSAENMFIISHLATLLRRI